MGQLFDSIKNNSIIKGFYVDNAQNRKLGRVGQPYDIKEEVNNSSKMEPDVAYAYSGSWDEDWMKAFEEDTSVSEDIKQILKEGDNLSAVYILNGKINIDGNIYVTPNESTAEVINIGKESSNYKKNEEYHNSEEYQKRKSLLDSISYYNADKLDDLLFGVKKYSNCLFEDNLNSGLAYKENWEDYYKDMKPKDKDEKFNRDTALYRKDMYNPFYNILDKLGIKTKEPEKYSSLRKYHLTEEDKEKIRNWIVNSPRTEFYKVLSGTKDQNFFCEILRYRFLKKYNKRIEGSIDTWNETDIDYASRKMEVKYDFQKRDNIIDLCSQIEYCVDDLLKEEKDKIFINNSNIEAIEVKDDDFDGGCWYNNKFKTITITKASIEQRRMYAKKSKEAATLLKEKYLVHTFLHEVGHSTQLTVYEKDKEDFIKFAEILGWKGDSYDYEVYKNSIKGGALDGDGYIKIKRNNPKLAERFTPLFIEREQEWKLKDDNDFFEGDNELFGIKRGYGPKELYRNTLNKIFITDYASTSACEAYAEYFSFYVTNKKALDKDIAEYKKSPISFCKKKDMREWFKYLKPTEYATREERSEIANNYGYFKRQKGHDDFYAAMVDVNMQLLIQMQKMVNKL